MHQRVGNSNRAASKCFHVSSVAFENWTRHFGNDSVDFGPECRSSAHLVSLEFRVSEKTAGGAAWLKSMNSNRADALRSRCHAFGIRHVLSLGPEAGFLETKEQTAVVSSIKSRFFGVT